MGDAVFLKHDVVDPLLLEQTTRGQAGLATADDDHFKVFRVVGGQRNHLYFQSLESGGWGTLSGRRGLGEQNGWGRTRHER